MLPDNASQDNTAEIVCCFSHLGMPKPPAQVLIKSVKFELSACCSVATLVWVCLASCVLAFCIGGSVLRRQTKLYLQIRTTRVKASNFRPQAIEQNS